MWIKTGQSGFDKKNRFRRGLEPPGVRRALSGEMREVQRTEVDSIGGKFTGCDNYGREQNENNDDNEEEEEKERKKRTLVALPSISIGSSMETDSTGTGSNIS